MEGMNMEKRYFNYYFINGKTLEEIEAPRIETIKNHISYIDTDYTIRNAITGPYPSIVSNVYTYLKSMTYGCIKNKGETRTKDFFDSNGYRYTLRVSVISEKEAVKEWIEKGWYTECVE